MENIENNRLIDRVIEALKKSAVEMEKFQVKVALGKAEAKDSFEEIKKNLNLFIHKTKFKIKSSKDKVDDVNAKLDELRVQLNLGKAESIETFHLQKKRLLLTIHELEVKIRSNDKLKKMYAIVLIEIETFKIQLEILEIKWKENMVKSKLSFKKNKEIFYEFIEKLKVKYAKKKETKWEHFHNEVSQAFNHLKQAFN